MNLKRNRRGEPICSECGKIFGSKSHAVVVDDELVCFACMRKWAEEDIDELVSYLAPHERIILDADDIEKLCEDDDEAEIARINEFFREVMRS